MTTTPTTEEPEMPARTTAKAEQAATQPEPGPLPVDPDRDPRWALLARPFPAEAVSLLPKQVRKDDNDKGRCEQGSRYTADGHACGGWHARSVHLDYVGHADVTDRLNEVDPTWNWEPMALTQGGTPLFTDGGLWIRLTVLDVTRLGFGDAQGKTGPNAVKEIIGDAIRNAALRFGVASYLWSKSEAAKAKARQEGGDVDEEPAAPAREPEPVALTPAQIEGQRAERMRAVLADLPQTDEAREGMREWWSQQQFPDAYAAWTPEQFQSVQAYVARAREAHQRRQAEKAASAPQEPARPAPGVTAPGRPSQAVSGDDRTAQRRAELQARMDAMTAQPPADLSPDPGLTQEAAARNVQAALGGEIIRNTITDPETGVTVDAATGQIVG